MCNAAPNRIPTENNVHLTLNVLWANLTDDKLMVFFLFFQENRV